MGAEALRPGTDRVDGENPKEPGDGEELLVLGRLAAAVSRDVASPLTYAIGVLGRASRELRRLRHELARGERVDVERLGPDIDDLARLLRDATEGATLVIRIARELQSVAPPDRERTLDPRDALETALRILKKDLSAKARVVREYEPVPLVETKETRLVQAILAMLLGAAEAIPPGAPRRNAMRVATYTDEEGRAVIEVRESGVLIASERAPRGKNSSLRIVLDPADREREE